jgi:hypothetical protein
MDFSLEPIPIGVKRMNNVMPGTSQACSPGRGKLRVEPFMYDGELPLSPCLLPQKEATIRCSSILSAPGAESDNLTGSRWDRISGL